MTRLTKTPTHNARFVRPPDKMPLGNPNIRTEEFWLTVLTVLLVYRLKLRVYRLTGLKLMAYRLAGLPTLRLTDLLAFQLTGVKITAYRLTGL